MLAIAYHEDYKKYDLGAEHPLIGDKPKRTLEFLKERGILEGAKVFKPSEASEKDLLRVHTQEYINLVKDLSKHGGLLSLDTPAPKGIYEAARLATGGTMMIGKKVFEGFRYGINPLGGFHHASRDRSSGFCFFNDIAVTIEYLRERYRLKKFLVIDLDVHHGNGTQEIYYNDPTVLQISLHQNGRSLYPGTGFIDEIGEGEGKGFKINVPLPPGTGNDSYFYVFNELVPKLMKQFKPELIIYQSGVDTHHSDPLAQLNLTLDAYYELAKKISKLSDSICKKLIIPMGGGYNSLAAVQAYYNIVCGILGVKDFIKEPRMPDLGSEKVKETVSKLKSKLSDYWDLD